MATTLCSKRYFVEGVEQAIRRAGDPHVLDNEWTDVYICPDCMNSADKELRELSGGTPCVALPRAKLHLAPIVQALERIADALERRTPRDA